MPADYPLVGPQGPKGDTGPPGVGAAASGRTYAVVGPASSFWSTPDSAALDLTTVADLSVLCLPTSLASGAVQTLISKSNPTGNQRGYRFQIGSTGLLSVTFSKDGTSTNSVTLGMTRAIGAILPALAIGHAPVWLRVKLESNVAGKSQATFSYSYDGTHFEVIGVVTNATVGPFFANTSPMFIGVLGDGSNPLTGRIYRAHVYDAGGTQVADFNGSAISSTPAAITGSTGEVWTPQASAARGMDELNWQDFNTAVLDPAALLSRPVGVMINPLDPKYGAVGDGVTDDYPALQAALNDVPDMGYLYVPHGKVFALSQALIGGTSGAPRRLGLWGSGILYTLGTNQIFIHVGVSSTPSDWFVWDGVGVMIGQHHPYDQALVKLVNIRGWRSNMPIFNSAAGNKFTATALQADVSYNCECSFETFGTRAVVPIEFTTIDHSGADDDILIHNSTSRNAPIIIRSDPTKIPDCIRIVGYRGVAFTSDYDLNFDTTLASPASPGDTVIHVTDASGLVADKPVQVGRGQNYEFNWIVTGGITGTAVTLQQPIRFAQAAGEPVVLGGTSLSIADALAVDISGHWGEGYRWGARLSKVSGASFRGRNDSHIGVCIDDPCQNISFGQPLSSSGWPTPTPDNYLWGIPAWNTDATGNTGFFADLWAQTKTATTMPDPPFYDPGGRMNGGHWRVRMLVLDNPSSGLPNAKVYGVYRVKENIPTGLGSNDTLLDELLIGGVAVAARTTLGNLYLTGKAGGPTLFSGSHAGTPEGSVKSDIGGECVDALTGTQYYKATGDYPSSTGWATVTRP